MSCPVCENPSDNEFAPFCSRLCKNRDLLKWLTEEYRLPGQEISSEDSVPIEEEENEAMGITGETREER